MISSKFVKEIPHEKINNKIINVNHGRMGEAIWEKGGWYKDATSHQIKEFITVLLDDFPIIIVKNYDDCKSKLEEVHYRKEKYFRILNKLKTAKLPNEDLKIHDPDDIIILDAHDLATNHFVSRFVTGDLKLLKFKEIILECTEIQDMINLKTLKI